ncbi:hypothetical protein SCORR_v1c05790 [Spiroplasma corruscae]|uniref:Uncharacterized protein n=1 Tax=Spiroplasma corruscae TaxID=216934 RepID=A0A222EPS0_9MOLU|nr:hypothetical protein [Spiroplasma corruscae]ASP28351.1 hypothetical protein SCORR_v1c05790 [Spiroplasma corruscae]
MNQSPYYFLTNTDIEIWNNSLDCDCEVDECISNHKLCALCKKVIIFNSYEACQPTSQYKWNIDHIIPKSRFNELTNYANLRNIYNVNDKKNKQITHVICNKIKGDEFNPNFENGFGFINNTNI